LPSLAFRLLRGKVGQVVRNVDGNNIEDFALHLFDMADGLSLVRVNLLLFPCIDD
jgi:hypothetical protein